MLARSLRLVCLVVLSSVAALTVGAPAPPPRKHDLRTYRFKARVLENGGVTPFNVGELVTGRFACDHDAPNTATFPPGLKWRGIYKSKHNAMSFRLGDLDFVGSREIVVSIS